MSYTLKPESLPDWPYTDLKAEELTLLACLLGRHGERKLTGIFGQAMMLWELLRHQYPGYSTMFPERIECIVSTPGFPEQAFLTIEEKDRAKLIELFPPEQTALEIGSIQMLDANGILERCKQLATLVGEKRHLGKEAVRAAFEKWLNLNCELFPKIDTSIAAQRQRDPRLILRNLAILRLVKLYGYAGARTWTREHRLKAQTLRKPFKSKYERYFGERGRPEDRPIFRDFAQYVNAVDRALDAIVVAT